MTARPLVALALLLAGCTTNNVLLQVTPDDAGEPDATPASHDAGALGSSHPDAAVDPPAKADAGTDADPPGDPPDGDPPDAGEEAGPACGTPVPATHMPDQTSWEPYPGCPACAPYGWAGRNSKMVPVFVDADAAAGAILGPPWADGGGGSKSSWSFVCAAAPSCIVVMSPQLSPSGFGSCVGTYCPELVDGGPNQPPDPACTTYVQPGGVAGRCPGWWTCP